MRSKLKTYQYAFLNRLARRWGYRLYAPNTNWFEHGDFKAAWAGFPDPANTIHDRRFNLWNLAKAFAHIPGDLAECGVFRGRGCHLMLSANPGKFLHGFDSFDGLSEPAPQDGATWTKHTFATPEDLAARNLSHFDGRFTLYKGWIPERFSEVEDRRFSFVHVDVDLYEPTGDAFAFFWPRLNAGGAIVCDDYGSINCPGARKAVDEFAASVGQQAAELATGQSVLVKPC